MKVRIEVLARNDLVEGYEFYEGNEEGLGEFFGMYLLRHRVSPDFRWNSPKGIPLSASGIIS